MKKYILTILISLLFFASSASSAILFYEDFEDELDFVLDPTRDWVYEHDGTGYVELSSEQARAGSKSYKFSATGSTYGNYVRQEIQLRNLWNSGTSYYFSQRTEYWIGYSIFLPAGYESPDYGYGTVSHHQYHTTEDGPPTCDPIEDGHHGLMIKTLDGNWYNWIHYDANQCTDGTIQGVYHTYDAFEVGKWTDFVVHVYFDYDNDGYLQIWKDGILIEDYSGPTWANDNWGPFFKHGIYGTIDVGQVMTVYIDEYRIGDADSSFAEVSPPHILFYEDFEDAIDTANDWTLVPEGTGSQALSEEQKRAGSKSYKFSCTGSSAARVRQELSLKNYFAGGDYHFDVGSEYWIGYSIYLDSGYSSPAESGTWGPIHTQWHRVSDGSPTCVPNENTDGPQPIYTLTEDGNWRSAISWDEQQCTDSESWDAQWNTYSAFETGKWIDFVFHIIWDYDEDGLTEIWKDGVKILSRSGGNCRNDVIGSYLRLGIYAFLDEHQVTIVYYDEFRLGDENSSYSEVAPTSSPAPSAPTVTVSQPTDVTSISATGQGTLVNVGSDNATKRGFCWNSTGSPTIADSKVEETGNFGESDIGTFTGSITGLNPSQHYYVKAYAYNTAGYGYSSAIEFYTQSSTSEISKAGWSLKYVDSEETVGEHGNATNAFDDNESTIWHTQWYGADPVCPHEIQINLGASYDLTGFRYMPRQDGGDNGRINGYEFYTSTDGENWGSAVADGNFTDTAYEQEDLFTSVTGQYVKLIATSSHDNDAWTTVAEIGVLGGAVGSGVNIPSRTYGVGLSGCSLK